MTSKRTTLPILLAASSIVILAASVVVLNKPQADQLALQTCESVSPTDGASTSFDLVPSVQAADCTPVSVQSKSSNPCEAFGYQSRDFATGIFDLSGQGSLSDSTKKKMLENLSQSGKGYFWKTSAVEKEAFINDELKKLNAGPGNQTTLFNQEYERFLTSLLEQEKVQDWPAVETAEECLAQKYKDETNREKGLGGNFDSELEDSNVNLVEGTGPDTLNVSLPVTKEPTDKEVQKSQEELATGANLNATAPDTKVTPEDRTGQTGGDEALGGSIATTTADDTALGKAPEQAEDTAKTKKESLGKRVIDTGKHILQRITDPFTRIFRRSRSTETTPNNQTGTLDNGELDRTLADHKNFNPESMEANEATKKPNLAQRLLGTFTNPFRKAQSGARKLGEFIGLKPKQRPAYFK